MTINDIKNMSDVEFINYIEDLRKEDKKYLNQNLKNKNKIINVGSIFTGMTFGGLSSLFADYFTNDEVTLGIVFVISSLIGIPMTRNLVRLINKKCLELNAYNDKQNILDIKNDIENLSNEDLLILKDINNNSTMLEMYNKIIYIIDCENNEKFFEDLEVIYEQEEEEELKYSKNIIKNN